MISCPECGASISEQAASCPKCGHPMKQVPDPCPRWRGFEWKSKTKVLGWPLVHVAFGRDKQTGKLLVAKGIIAIGQFALGLVTIAQFGVGVLFGLGQFVGGVVTVGQFALGIYFGLGQFATGITAIGQFAFGKYVLAQAGFGEYVWSTKVKDPVAIEYFNDLLQRCKDLIGIS